MGIGAAIAGGAALSAVGGIAASSMSSKASQSAANTQAQASDAASQATQQEHQQIRSDLAPFTNGAQTNGDLTEYNNYFNDAQPEEHGILQQIDAAQPQAMTEANLVNTPGYQFDLSQGLKSIQSANAAKGLGVSGAALKGAATYATGLADNTYQNQFGIQQQQFNDALNSANFKQGQLNSQFNYLASPVQTSQNSAALTASTGLQSTANSNNALIAGANATAAGQVGSANAISSGISGIGNSATSGIQNYMLAQALQNPSGGGGGYVDSGSF
jgi:hypothetical protein